MPIIVDEATGSEREVDLATYQRLRQQVLGQQKDQLITAVPGDVTTQRLWDCLEQSWTKPLPRAQTLGYLGKQVTRCSACDYSTNTGWGNGNGVRAHVATVARREAEHTGAVIGPLEMDHGQARAICSGCGLSLSAEVARQHILGIRQLAEAHVGRVEAILVSRFTLGPSEPVTHGRQVVREAQLDARPVVKEVSPVEGVHRSRRRRRKRGRGSSINHQ